MEQCKVLVFVCINLEIHQTCTVQFTDFLSFFPFSFPNHRCENIMTCPMREIGSGAEHCPYDWLAVYDGRDDHAPLIGKFCGVGKFPFSIIGKYYSTIHCFSYIIFCCGLFLVRQRKTTTTTDSSL